jgi:hypothetical protein
MMTPTEINDASEWGRKIIEIYMSWYTFFFTANLVIMGWCFGKESPSRHHRPLMVIAGLFSFLNLMGAVSTMKVGWSVAPVAPPKFQNLITWSAWINASALVGTAVVWLLLIHTLRPRKVK